MSGLPLGYLLALIAAVAAAPLGSREVDVNPENAPADALFKAGKFAEAEPLYAAITSKNEKDYHSTVRLGYLALLSNRLDDAQKWLERAIELSPGAMPAKHLLAEVFYRRDDFRQAAPLLREVGREAMAKKLESFQGSAPYMIQAASPDTSVTFILTDPLPLLRVKVNGSEEVNFFIDTGAAEVVLDTQFAKQVGAKLYGDETGRFAGGRRAAYQHARVNSLKLGDVTVSNLPVQIMDTRRFAGVFGGKRVDGIIGTILLRHFISTIDYPRGRLVLQPKTKENQARLARADGTIVVPFWMAGDHFMVAWGTLDQSKPVLLFVDTGLAGGGITCAESLLKEAAIDLAEDQAGEGLGGGGKVKVVPFLVKELSLGAAKEHDVRGLFTGPFPLEYSHGFRIGGLISHGFFRPYALTFDFAGMRLILKRENQP
jgi:Aspartyl protease